MNFKSGQERGHMRDFIYINCCAKGFFTERSILEDKWLLKMTKNMRKCVFLFNEWKLEKVIEFRPPLFFNFRGGHPSSIFSNSCSFLRYAFLGLKFIFQNIDFWKKSFYYSSFYTKKISFDPVLAHFWNSSAPPNDTYRTNSGLH